MWEGYKEEGCGGFGLSASPSHGGEENEFIHPEGVLSGAEEFIMPENTMEKRV